MIKRIIGVSKKKSQSENKRFSFESGERQTGDSLGKIRADHLVRYELALNKIQSECNRTDILFGLDVFCGNGYGSYLLSDKSGCSMMGIDASSESIEFARKFYSTSNVFFSAKEFPFSLPVGIADFVVCFESLEHVRDSKRLVNEIVRSLKPGAYVFISTPNEKIMSLRKNSNKFHFRHFGFDEVFNEFVEKRGLILREWYGQNVYSMNDVGCVTGLLPVEMMQLTQNIQGQFNVFVFQSRIDEGIHV